MRLGFSLFRYRRIIANLVHLALRPHVSLARALERPKQVHSPTRLVGRALRRRHLGSAQAKLKALRLRKRCLRLAPPPVCSRSEGVTDFKAEASGTLRHNALQRTLRRWSRPLPGGTPRPDAAASGASFVVVPHHRRPILDGPAERGRHAPCQLGADRLLCLLHSRSWPPASSAMFRRSLNGTPRSSPAAASPSRQHGKPRPWPRGYACNGKYTYLAIPHIYLVLRDATLGLHFGCACLASKHALRYLLCEHT